MTEPLIPEGQIAPGYEPYVSQTTYERQVNIITILACDRCCDDVKRLAREGKAFNHCCCKPSREP